MIEKIFYREYGGFIMKSITFRMEDELYEQIMAFAKMEDRNKSDFIRLVMKKYIQQQKKKEDAEDE